jgi:hypothetical protein
VGAIVTGHRGGQGGGVGRLIVGGDVVRWWGRRLDHRWQASRTDGAAYREEEEGAKCAERPLTNFIVICYFCLYSIPV